MKTMIKSVYGKDLIYPVDDEAKLFAELLGKKTFTRLDLKTIEALGHKVEYVPYGWTTV